jgi:hypothetical protein
MSFDIFNYAPTLAEIDTTVAALNSRVLISTRRQCDIAGMTGGAKEIMSGEAKRLVESIAADNENVNELTEIKKKIQSLCDLPLTIKNQLYAVYCVMSERRVDRVNISTRMNLSDFATRLPICYEGMMIDVIPLLKHNPREEQQEKMRAVYKKYEALHLPMYYRWVPAESIM